MKVFASLLLILSTYQSSFSQCPSGYVPELRNLVYNSGFDLGNKHFQSDYLYSSHDLWDEGKYSIGKNPNLTHAGFVAISDHTSGSGTMMIVNGAPERNQTIWEQKVRVKPNMVYVFVVWATNVSSVENPPRLQFSINGRTNAKAFKVEGDLGEWKPYYVQWTSSPSTKEAKLSIVNQNVERGGNDFALDDVYLVPCGPIMAQEPATDKTLWEGLVRIDSH